MIYLRNILLLKASFHNSHVLPICSDRRALVLLQNTEYIPVNHAYICLHYCNTYYFLFASVLRVHSPNTIDVLLLQGQPKQNVVFIHCPIFMVIFGALRKCRNSSIRFRKWQFILGDPVLPIYVYNTYMVSFLQPKLTTAKCRRNVENFLLACRKIGVREVSFLLD